MNYALSSAYDAARNGQFDAHLQDIAEAADDAAGAVMEQFAVKGVKFPGDDRMMRIELQIFETALWYHGYDYTILANALELRA